MRIDGKEFKPSPLSELSPVARGAILRGLKGRWEDNMTTEEKLGYLRAGRLDFCVAAGIPQDELDELMKIVNSTQPEAEH